MTHVINITDVGHLTSDADTGEDKMERAAAAAGRTRGRDRRALHGALAARPRAGGLPAPGGALQGHRAHPGADRAGAAPRGEGLHLPDRRRDLLRHLEVPPLRGLRAARPGGPGGRGAHRRRGGQAQRRRLRALEVRGAGCQASAGVGLALGPRLPRLASRVLGDEHPLPRRQLRHPHGRRRPDPRAPHQRDRPERVRLRRAPLGALLAAQRVPGLPRREDVEVDGQRLPARRPGASRACRRSPTATSSCRPTTGSSRPSPTMRSRRRPPATSACWARPPSCARRRARPTRPGSSRCASASATPLRDDLNAPRALAVAWEVVRHGELAPAERWALLREFDAALGLDLERALPRAERAGERSAHRRAGRPSARRRAAAATSPRRTASATSSPPRGSCSKTRRRDRAGEGSERPASSSSRSSRRRATSRRRSGRWSRGVERGDPHQTLLGVTGSGKSFTIACVVEQVNRPTLVMAPNKTLAAQLYAEFKGLFPDNAVEYFVSYYDYYQPEAYIPSTDTYIEKDSSINDEIDKLRHSTTHSLLTRRDVLVVASVSCIYGLGAPETYGSMHVYVEAGMQLERDDLLRRLVDMLYERNDLDFHRGTFRVRGDVVEVFPAVRGRARAAHRVLRRRGRGDRRDRPAARQGAGAAEAGDDLSGEPLRGDGRGPRARHRRHPRRAPGAARASSAGRASCSRPSASSSARSTTSRCSSRWASATASRTTRAGSTAAGRARRPTRSTTTSPTTCWWCSTRATSACRRSAGCTAATARARRRSSSTACACPRRSTTGRCASTSGRRARRSAIYVSATPAEYELERSQGRGGRADHPADRARSIRRSRCGPRPGRWTTCSARSAARVEAGERVLVTTLTKRMAEELTDYYAELGVRVRYLHSDIKTIERMEIIRELREGEFDVLVGHQPAARGARHPRGVAGRDPRRRQGGLPALDALADPDDRARRAQRERHGDPLRRQADRLDPRDARGDRPPPRAPDRATTRSTGSRPRRS